jgi:DNA-binding ferritin-like protein
MCPRSHLNESRSYQEHLTAASKSVTERQDEIGERIRVVERNAAARANRVGKLAQFMQKAEDRLTDVAALHSDVLRMNDMIHCAL